MSATSNWPGKEPKEPMEFRLMGDPMNRKRNHPDDLSILERALDEVRAEDRTGCALGEGVP